MRYIVSLISLAVFFQSCGGPSEKQVRSTSQRSLELGQKYIANQYRDAQKTLEKRIAALDKDIDKLKDVSSAGQQGAGDNLNSSIVNLTREREEEQAKLNTLQEKAKASDEMLQRHWNIYNTAMDSILLDMNNFLEPIRKTEAAEKKP